MENKIMLKKVIILNLVIIVIANIIFGFASYYEYRTYTDIFNKKVSLIVSKVLEQYPNIDKNDVMYILNNDMTQSDFSFEDYGIDLNKDSLILKNDKYFIKFLLFNMIIATILLFSVLIVFLIYNNSRNKTLMEITRYIEQINRKNYKLDINDNTEDELSILKSEIYKTTVMLKEVSENSIQDKINIKNSLSDISHQIKTPLTSISIMLDNILDNANMDIETRNTFIKDIKKEILNINFLISSLLKLSKFETNIIKFVKREEYVKDIIDQSLKNISSLCDLKDINISINGNEDLKIVCDFRWQVEAITNILKNCIEHSNSGGKVFINYEECTLYTKIEIKDLGNGIDTEDLPHIFERFYNGKNANFDSIGIGLALAKSIIENSNGYISVTSNEQNGTIFIIKYFKN